MIIKVCGITTKDDALLAIEYGATALGFNFYLGSPRYISTETVAHIVQELPPSILKVGVFVNEKREEVQKQVAETGIDIAQLHGDETPEDVLEYEIRVWKAFRVTFDWQPHIMEFYRAEAYLLDGPAGALFGGTGESFDPDLALDLRKPIVMAGGLDGTNVASVIEKVRPKGVDACSRLELSPGRKDRTRMRDFIQAAADAFKETERPFVPVKVIRNPLLFPAETQKEES